MFLLLLLGLALPASAQQVQLQMQQEPHYVGEPILLRVFARGFEPQPQPACAPGPVSEGAVLKFVRSSRPNVVKYEEWKDGRRTVREEVTWAFDYHLTADKPGICELPAFTVDQGGRRAATRPVSVRLREMAVDPDMRVGLIVPDRPLYVGERAPVTVEWWYAGSLEDVSQLSIRSPLFDTFRFADDPAPADRTQLPIATAGGPVGLAATASNRQLDGRTFLVLSATRRLALAGAGTFDLAPITATLSKVTRWERDIFTRRPAAVERIRAMGEPLRLEVRPVPLAEAPAGFAGVVGRGMAIGVKADRTVVQAGDPIALTVTLQGDADLRNARGPVLDGDAGLDPGKFHLPDAEITGVLSEDGRAKTFAIVVRVLRETVDALPPIAYSWFDPVKQSFETAQSDPIALRVLPAQVVGAADVVRREQVDGAADAATPQPVGPVPANVEAAPRRRVSLGGANLAIATDVAHLLTDASRRFGGSPVRMAIYGLSLAAVLAAALRRRAARVDPQQRERRRLLRRESARIDQALRRPGPGAAAEIADALRRVVAHVEGPVRGQLDAVLAECDVLAFAPQAEGPAPIDEPLRGRAVELARALRRESG